MTVDPTPVSVDYTSRDYVAIREALIARVKERVPEWKATDAADFGLALVEAFAYMGDNMSYYLDRVANETQIATATQRSTVVALAKTLGYTPAGYQAAEVTLTIDNKSDSSVTVPIGTRVSGIVTSGDTRVRVVFETLADVTVNAASGGENGTNTVLARQGETLSYTTGNSYGRQVQVSNGTPEFTFTLPDSPIVEGSINLWVKEGTSYRKWNQVQQIMDSGPLDPVYAVSDDGFGIVTVTFGDGISGSIPTINNEIWADYRVGGGSVGNVPVSTLHTLETIPGLTAQQVSAIAGVLEFNNNANATGGADPEDTAFIRKQAPRALRALNRAVTLADYEALALSVSRVGKAKAELLGPPAVILYLAPYRSPYDNTDPHPGIDDLGDPTNEWESIKVSANDYVTPRMLLGTSLTILPPVYTTVDVNLSVQAFPEYSNVEVEEAVKVAVLDFFSYNNQDFGQEVSKDDIEFIVRQVPGVKTVSVSNLMDSSASYGGPTNTLPIQADAYEIFVTDQNSVVLSVSGGSSLL